MAAPVEKKVTAATAVSALVGIVIAVLNAVVGNASLLGPLPGWAQALVLAVAPAALTFLGGWKAAHTPRVLE